MHTTSEHRRADLGTLAYALILLAATLAFQGSRGIFEPDEGRYVDIATAMLRSGDWWIPRLQGLIYLDKPPMIYWTVAAGIKLLGANEWGARLGQALALTATALVTASWAGRHWGVRMGRLAGAAYVTTLLPVVAANAVTPDTLLALWTTTAAFAYWRHRGAATMGHRWGWALLWGASLGLGLLTKGTAALVFLAPIGLHVLWDRRLWKILRSPETWAALVLAAGIGTFWYVQVAERLPGAAQYFYDNQVAGRLWADTYDRNAHWWSPFEVYGGALLLGSLPWSLAWLGLAKKDERRERLRRLGEDPLTPFLLLAAGVPLVVFSLASSRLPLYILPIFPMLILLTVRFAASAAERPAWPRRVVLAMLAVVALRAAGAVVPIHRDSSSLAAALESAEVGAGDCLIVVQEKAHALGFYGYERTFWTTLWPDPYPYFESPPPLEDLLPRELPACGSPVHFLVKPKHTEQVENTLAGFDLACTYAPLSSRMGHLRCSSGRPAEAPLPPP